MASVRYVVGDATRPEGEGAKIIAHVCNDVGAWGAGFVVAISRRWVAPEWRYRERSRGKLELGEAQFVEVEPGLTVANLIGQRGVGAGRDGEPPIRYDAVRRALERVAEHAIETRASVHMPRIGCGLAGGAWERMGPIVEETLARRGVEVVVYDLAPRGAPG